MTRAEPTQEQFEGCKGQIFIAGYTNTLTDSEIKDQLEVLGGHPVIKLSRPLKNRELPKGYCFLQVDPKDCRDVYHRLVGKTLGGEFLKIDLVNERNLRNRDRGREAAKRSAGYRGRGVTPTAGFRGRGRPSAEFEDRRRVAYSRESLPKRRESPYRARLPPRYEERELRRSRYEREPRREYREERYPEDRYRREIYEPRPAMSPPPRRRRSRSPIRYGYSDERESIRPKLKSEPAPQREREVYESAPTVVFDKNLGKYIVVSSDEIVIPRAAAPREHLRAAPRERYEPYGRY